MGDKVMAREAAVAAGMFSHKFQKYKDG